MLRIGYLVSVAERTSGGMKVVSGGAVAADPCGVYTAKNAKIAAVHVTIVMAAFISATPLCWAYTVRCDVARSRYDNTVGLLLRIVTLPLTILTFGIFSLLINALMLRLAALVMPGFEVRGLWPAFIGGLILSLLNLTVRQVLLGNLAH